MGFIFTFFFIIWFIYKCILEIFEANNQKYKMRQFSIKNDLKSYHANGKEYHTATNKRIYVRYRIPYYVEYVDYYTQEVIERENIERRSQNEGE